MATTNEDVIDFLRARFARVDEQFAAMREDLRNLSVRVTSIEAEMGHQRIGLAEVNARLDGMGRRMERIERRLDLIDEPAA